VEQTTETTRKPLTDDEVLAIVKQDFETAKENKVLVDKKIQGFKDLYEGKPLGNETDGRSQYVAKEAQKAVNWWIPNAMKPFMSSDDIVGFEPRTFDDISTAESQNVLLNYQFNNGFPKYQFLYSSLQLYASEGTVVCRTGWIHEEETEEIPFDGLNRQQIAMLMLNGAELELEDQAEIQLDPMESPLVDSYQTVYKGVARITKTTVSRPDAETLKNEDFYIIGETVEDSDCCIQRIDTTKSELRKQDVEYNKKGIYQNVDKIQCNGIDERDSGLGQERANDLREYGQDEDTKKYNDTREAVTIYEYYGNIDRNGDGIAEPIVCVWSGNVILRISDNPFPDKEPPFISAPFMPVPFSFWGNGLPHYLEDITKVKSAIMRTFIDLMAHSTNGMNHVEKGSIDAYNMRKLREAKIGTVVEWNRLSGYHQQQYNEIPPALQAMYELFTGEGENESGLTRYNQGLDAKSLNKTATGITAIMSQSQMRTWETVTRFAEQYLKPLFRKWIAYNQAFLDMNIATRVAGNRYVSVSKDDISGEFDLKVSVAIGGTNEDKAQKIISMLQIAPSLVQMGIVPQTHLGKLIAELEELWEFKDLAEELRELLEGTSAQQVPQGIPDQGMIQ